MKTFIQNGSNLQVSVNGGSYSNYTPEIGDIIIPQVNGVKRAPDSIEHAYLEDMYSYGIEWDSSVSSTICTRIGNPLLHKSLPIQSQYKGCVAQKGQIMYYLNPNDWSKKADGTASRLDGYDGVVKVATPRFYGKSGVNGTKRWVRISTVKIDNSWTEIPALLIDAYQPTIINSVPSNFGYMSTLPVNSLVSIANTATWCRGGGNRSSYDTYLSSEPFRTDLGKPRTAITRPNYRTYANNAGEKLITYDLFKWVVWWSYAIEYANFNSQIGFNAAKTADGYAQGGLGNGLTNVNSTKWSEYTGYYPLCPNGYTNNLGNFSGTKQMTLPATASITSSSTHYAIRWRGLENIFGNIWTFIDGIVLNGTNVYTGGNTDDKSKLKLISTKRCTSSGNTQDIDLQSTGEFIPSAVGSSKFGDYYWYAADDRLLLVGGCAHDGSQAGLFAFVSNFGLAHAYAHIGALSYTELR